MSMPDYNAAIDAVVASLAAALPTRKVQSSLDMPESALREDLLAGLLCVVSESGGKFANYRGREGQQGQIKVSVVGYLLVEEGTAKEAIQRAELTLLNELLAWVASPVVVGINTVTPGDWVQSKQLEHPYGWLVLELVLKP